MKIIFLDIDWVMNSLENHFDVKKFDSEKIKLLEEVLDKTEAKIVLSSSWRTSFAFMESFKDRFWEKIWNALIWATPYLNDYDEWKRWEEILQYLKWNPLVKNYVIIDDDDFDIVVFEELVHHFVLSDYKTWITKENVEEMVEILNKV